MIDNQNLLQKRFEISKILDKIIDSLLISKSDKKCGKISLKSIFELNNDKKRIKLAENHSFFLVSFFLSSYITINGRIILLENLSVWLKNEE